MLWVKERHDVGGLVSWSGGVVCTGRKKNSRNARRKVVQQKAICGVRIHRCFRRESAPEPDVVMDSDEDFEPVESEDEVVPWNIEIARNPQKTQPDMVKQVGKTRREGDYQIGDWVSLDKEPRAGLSKMDAV